MYNKNHYYLILMNITVLIPMFCLPTCNHLGDNLILSTCMYIDFIVYDDGCHLRKYAANPSRSAATETTKRIANMSIVVDKLHFKGHKDPWCLENCNPYSHKELEGVGHIS